MNHTADQRRIVNNPREVKHRGGSRRRKAGPLTVLGWIAVGIAGVLLVVFYFNPDFNTSKMRLLNLNNSPKVIRAKIPEEIKNAANIHRAKIPAVNQPGKKSIEIKDTTVAAKQTMPSQPMVARPEQREPPRKTDLLPPLESKIKTEMKPTVTKVFPSKAVIAPPKKSEPTQETDLLPPIDSRPTYETKPSLAKTPPSQPPFAPPEQNESGQEIQPDPPMESRLKMETMAPMEQPAVTTVTTAPAPEQKKERLENTDLRPTEAGLQPVKEVFEENTEDQVIQNEKWLLSQEPSHYTIQIMGVRKEELLFDFVENTQWLEQYEVAFYQTTFKDKPWFQLLYGVYPTKKDARSAADALPPKIRESSPWIRRLSGVQKAIRRHAAR